MTNIAVSTNMPYYSIVSKHCLKRKNLELSYKPDEQNVQKRISHYHQIYLHSITTKNSKIIHHLYYHIHKIMVYPALFIYLLQNCAEAQNDI